MQLRMAYLLAHHAYDISDFYADRNVKLAIIDNVRYSYISGYFSDHMSIKWLID